MVFPYLCCQCLLRGNMVTGQLLNKQLFPSRPRNPHFVMKMARVLPSFLFPSLLFSKGSTVQTFNLQGDWSPVQPGRTQAVKTAPWQWSLCRWIKHPCWFCWIPVCQHSETVDREVSLTLLWTLTGTDGFALEWLHSFLFMNRAGNC